MPVQVFLLVKIITAWNNLHSTGKLYKNNCIIMTKNLVLHMVQVAFEKRKKYHNQ